MCRQNTEQLRKITRTFSKKMKYLCAGINRFVWETNYPRQVNTEIMNFNLKTKSIWHKFQIEINYCACFKES